MNNNFVNYQSSMKFRLCDNKQNTAMLEITLPIEVNDFKSKIEALGFSPNDIKSNCFYFNMSDEAGWNDYEMPKSKTLTEFNLIALIFEDINKLPPEKRAEYEKDAAKYHSYVSAAAYQYLTFEDIKYFHKVINKNEFPNQELRKRIKRKFFSKYYVAGVIRRSIESGKDYFSDDVCWLS